MRFQHFETTPVPIWGRAYLPVPLLSEARTWHASVRGLGNKGELTDAEMKGFVDPFEATRNLLTDAQRNLGQLTNFFELIVQHPNAAHL
jgi:hypothetical protein